MKNSNKLATVFSILALSSGSIWFGSYVSRLLITYQMFESTETVLKSYITNDNLQAIIQTNYPLVNLTFFSYIIFIVSFTIFLIATKLKLKENGWLLIVASIIYLTLPFECILLSIDLKLISLFLNEQFASKKVLELIVERISVLNSFPIILILSYLAIPFFLIVKPFKLKNSNEN